MGSYVRNQLARVLYQVRPSAVRKRSRKYLDCLGPVECLVHEEHVYLLNAAEVDKEAFLHLPA